MVKYFVDYVEILKTDGDFVIKNVEIGISDGVNVEIIEGVLLSDEIKVWNKAIDENNEDEENNDEE